VLYFFFKLVLLASVLGFVYLVMFRTRAILAQRVFGAAIGLVMCVFVIVPDLATRISNLFGIGRGADFLFYLSHAFIYFLFVRVYQENQRFQAQITELTRQLALSSPRKAGDVL